ncbi:hypothetical protein KY333_02730 [Candidatus Woesearchaeota archaeon]|nr:hypothetical protein [Candidatus Woesearchaeota archaeon]
MKGIFIKATPTNGPTLDYIKQNEKILEDLRTDYEIIIYHSLEHAAYQMTQDDTEKCRDAAFIITNIPYAAQTPEIAKIKSEKNRKRLEGLVDEERKKELEKISAETEFNAYETAFECFKQLKQVFPKMKIIAYTAAHENVRKKVYDEDLVFSVHQRGHKGGKIWERCNLVLGVQRALEGWRRCE